MQEVADPPSEESQAERNPPGAEPARRIGRYRLQYVVDVRQCSYLLETVHCRLVGFS